MNVMCNCNFGNYWKLYSRIERNLNDLTRIMLNYNYFKCVPMKKCQPQQFCGYARGDLGLIYQRCTCPAGYNCRFNQDSPFNNKIIELFYSDGGYKSYCETEIDNDY